MSLKLVTAKQLGRMVMSERCLFCKKEVVATGSWGPEGDTEEEGMYLTIGPFDLFSCFDCFFKHSEKLEVLAEAIEREGIRTIEEFVKFLTERGF